MGEETLVDGAGGVGGTARPHTPSGSVALPGLAPAPVPTLARAVADAREDLFACVHCGFCLPACPTYGRLGDENDSPRGRLYLMRAVVEERLDPGDPAFQTHIDRCLGCRACEPVCPSGVPYGSLLELARNEAAAARPPTWPTRLLLATVADHDRNRAFGFASRVLRATGLPALLTRWLPPVGILGRLRLALGMLASSGGWKGRSRTGAHGSDRSGDPGPGGTDTPGRDAPGGAVGHAEVEGPAQGAAVAILRGCVQEGLSGGVNRATRRVLEANGLRVLAAPGQACCGALHAHAGDLDGARTLARRNVDAFEAAGVEVVVANAAGCGAVMKEYGHLLAGDPEYASRAALLASRVRDVSEVLAARGPRIGGAISLRAGWDAPCHLVHAQGVSRPPLRVLESVPGLEVVGLENGEECCGGAGIYGLGHPDMGARLAADKVAAVRAAGVGLVVTANPGCAMQIGAGLRMAGAKVGVAHLVEVLDESYRRAGFYRSHGD